MDTAADFYQATTEMQAILDRLRTEPLPRMEQVKLALLLVRLDRQHRSEQGLPPRPGKAKELAAELLHISSALVARYQRVMSTPPTVQQAVHEGSLSLRDALRVARLETEDQAVIVALLTQGSPGHAAVSAVYQGVVRVPAGGGFYPQEMLVCQLDWAVAQLAANEQGRTAVREHLRRVREALERLGEGRRPTHDDSPALVRMQRFLRTR